MNKLITAALIALSSTLVLAQVPGPERSTAEVRKVDRDARKITLKHGPIKSLDMPAMTMVFQVRDAALLGKVAEGDKVTFTAEQQQGAYVLTSLEKAAP
mgnify:FL=1|jgi:Cu(I)/Ag(I) efflux system protein CusF